MTPVSVFAGFTSSVCALAKAEASCAIDSLQERKVASHGGSLRRASHHLEADRARLRALGPEAVAEGFLRLPRAEILQLALGVVVGASPSAAAAMSSAKFQGSMNLASKTADSVSTIPSRV